MALTAREYAERLRTIGRSGSKAPLQNVQLPTNQSRYQTPSMKSTSPGTAEMQGKAGANPAALAKAGGILGKIGKAGWDYFNRPETMALDKAGSANLGQIGGMMGMLQGSNADVAANMASQTGNALQNLPQPSMLGNGIPTEWGNMAANAGELGNLSTVGDAVNNANDAANAALEAGNASFYQLPSVGTALGVGLNAAQGNWGAAGGQLAGATIGSAFGPAGTAAGGFLGGTMGKVLDRFW